MMMMMIIRASEKLLLFSLPLLLFLARCCGSDGEYWE
jgi:hypothetical protein